MLWPWLLLTFIFMQLQMRFSVVTEFQNISLFLHNFCLQNVPTPSTSTAALSALVCGENFDRLSDTQLYSSTGLIHLFVVSGSHLLLIQNMTTQISQWTFRKTSYLFMLLLLFTYCSMCLFNPPVTRSFVFLILTLFLHRHHQYWPKHYVLLLAGLIALTLNFQWLTSLSLQMSWLAALALEISAHKLKNISVVFRQVIFYFLFLFCFMGLGFPQFSTVVLCAVMTPLLEYILFPLAILTVIFHVLEPLFTALMNLLNAILRALEFQSNISQLDMTYVYYLNWILILACHFILFQREVRT